MMAASVQPCAPVTGGGKPQRGGMASAGQSHAAPAGLADLIWGPGDYRQVAPTELVWAALPGGRRLVAFAFLARRQ